MAGEVKNIQMAAGAALTKLVGSDYGAVHSVTKGETATHTLLAAHPSKDRAVVVLVYVDEVFADGGGSQPVIEVGETTDIDLCFDHLKLVNAAAAGVWKFGFLNTSTRAVLITSTGAVGAGTGGVTVTVLAAPTS